MDGRLLNIVDQNGKIIGTDTRENIHNKGLLHREIHVWFITPEKEIIFQHRAKNVIARPNLLDATVAGHVEIGEDYLQSAIKEAKEETGVDIQSEKLKLIEIIHGCTKEEKTGKINNALRAIYAYEFSNSIDNLIQEEGKGIGFESYSLDQLKNLTETDKQKFIPALLSDTYMDLYEKMV